MINEIFFSNIIQNTVQYFIAYSNRKRRFLKQILATTEERKNKQVEKIPGPGFPFRIF